MSRTEEMRKVIADRIVEAIPGTRIPSAATSAERSMRPASPRSELDAALSKAVEAVTHRMFRGAPVLLSILTGAAEMAQIRAKGGQCYGIGPMVDRAEGGLGGAHSDDERIREDSIYKFVEFTCNPVVEIARPRAGGGPR